MKKIITIFLFLAATLYGQVVTPGVSYVSTAPTGACFLYAQAEFVVPSGTLYTCQNGTWGVLPGGTASSVSFSGVTSGTNTTGALVVGSGATLGATGTGTITATTAITNPFSGDNSTQAATDAFVGNALNFSQSRFAMNVTGGTYSFDSNGTGAQVIIFVSGGSVSSVIATANPGSGYAVGDLLFITPGGAVGGNGDAIIRVTGVSGTGFSSGSVVTGGTGYTATGLGSTVSAAYGRPYTFIWQGAVTSTVQIIMKFGTALTTSNQWIMANNTTGASGLNINVCEGNASDVCGAGSTVNLAQGVANSRQIILETDGFLNMFIGAIQNSLDLQFTAAAASNCNQSGVLTGVTSCLPLTVGGVIHYSPIF